MSAEPCPTVSTTLPEEKPPEDFEELKRVMTAGQNSKCEIMTSNGLVKSAPREFSEQCS